VELLPVKIVWLRYHILELNLKTKMKNYFQNLGDAFWITTKFQMFKIGNSFSLLMLMGGYAKASF
jgi:hypothetical protein